MEQNRNGEHVQFLCAGLQTSYSSMFALWGGVRFFQLLCQQTLAYLQRLQQKFVCSGSIGHFRAMPATKFFSLVYALSSAEGNAGIGVFCNQFCSWQRTKAGYTHLSCVCTKLKSYVETNRAPVLPLTSDQCTFSTPWCLSSLLHLICFIWTSPSLQLQLGQNRTEL